MRIILVALLVLLAGCAGTTQNSSVSLQDVYGDQALPQDNTTTVLLAGVLNSSLREITADPVTLNKGGTGVNDGILRALDEVAYEPVQVSFQNASQLGNLEARWAIHDVGSDSWQYVNKSAQLAIEVGNGTAGPFHVLAQLYSGNNLVANVTKLTVETVVTYVVSSSVWPVNPQGQAPLDDSQRNAMADRFTFSVHGRALATFDTRFDGTYTQTDGTDVDLELATGSGNGIFYVGAGGSGSATPTPAQATETITATLEPGDWMARAGYVSTICGGCYYHNVGTVPYVLTIELAYVDHTSQDPA